jgi:hypothetical protein
MTNRERIKELRGSIEVLQEMKASYCASYWRGFEEHVISEARQKFPKSRRKWNYDTAMKDLGEVGDRLLQEARKEFEATYSALTRQEDEKRQELRLLCWPEKSQQGTSKVLVSRVYRGTYSSQTAPEAYAKARAEIDLAEVSAQGILAELEECTEAHSWAVWAYVEDTEVDLAILNAHPMPLDEFVRLCWKHTVQPRVYLPFLPYDFEAKHGLDYQGNRK